MEEIRFAVWVVEKEINGKSGIGKNFRVYLVEIETSKSKIFKWTRFVLTARKKQDKLIFSRNRRKIQDIYEKRTEKTKIFGKKRKFKQKRRISPPFIIKFL